MKNGKQSYNNILFIQGEACVLNFAWNVDLQQHKQTYPSSHT